MGPSKCKAVRFGAASLLAVASLHHLHAQDTRLVTEPSVPRSCVVLFAHQMAGNLDEGRGKEILDTDRIQQAIDQCAPGHSVELAATVPRKISDPILNGFVTGPLRLKDSVTLRVDAHVTLFASRDPQLYEIGGPGPSPKCGTREPRPAASAADFDPGAPPRRKQGCWPLISVSNAHNAGVMGAGTIDGRGYAQIIGHDYSWWQLARAAQPNDDIYYSVRLIVADHADGFTLYGIHLVNSPNFHVSVAHTNGFTAWGVHLQTPTDKDLDARNTDGIDPGTSENITVAHSWIDNGDDNIAIKQGVRHMSVLDNHFYSGHGMSIGSETVLGVSDLLVDGLTEDHTTSGIRIKSNVTRGGPVHDLVYRNVCMRDVPVPISISPYYANHTTDPFADPGYRGNLIPDYQAIQLQNIFDETPGDVLIAGLNDQHRTGVTLSNVHIQHIRQAQMHLAFADIHYGVCTADQGQPDTNLPLQHVPASVHLLPTPDPACTVPATPAVDPCTGVFVTYQ